MLEEVIYELSIPDANYQFDINHEGLKLIFLDDKGAPKKTHYLNLLLQSADLTHLRLKQDFLDFYIKANKEKFKNLGVTSITDMEAMFAQRKLSPLEQKDDMQQILSAEYFYES